MLLKILSVEFLILVDFEWEFFLLCFVLVIGVGKMWLMGVFIVYLYMVYGINNFFVLVLNLIIYNKLIIDFMLNIFKYVFIGIDFFVNYLFEIIIGDNYEEWGWNRGLLSFVIIDIFNILKIVLEVRGGKVFKVKCFFEYLGDSYFNEFVELDDLVLLMDEFYCYWVSVGMWVINEFKFCLGLEFIVMSFIELNKGLVLFENVIVDYLLVCVMDDGFVKEFVVVI